MQLSVLYKTDPDTVALYVQLSVLYTKDPDTVTMCSKAFYVLLISIQLIDFSEAFDGVNHLGILYKFCSIGIGGSVWSILTQFLSNRSQHVIVDDCRSKLVNVVSGVPQGSVLCQLLFLLYTSELFSILKNKLISYADDSTN